MCVIYQDIWFWQNCLHVANVKEFIITESGAGQERFPNLSLSSLQSVIWLKNCYSKRGVKECLGGLKCSQNAKKNKKSLKISCKAILNAHFIYLVSKESFSYNIL